MQTQKELVDYLINTNILKTKSIIETFLSIDRKDFMTDDHEEDAYINHAIPIGHGQTNSQPTVVAFMLELLKPKKGERILDIGCGSGWTTALLAECVGERGKVIGIELVPELVAFGKRNLNKYNYPQAKILKANHKRLGLPAEAPFDKILVSAAASTLPNELVAQFTKKLVIPIQNSIWLIDKRLSGKLKKKEYFGYAFVPLIKS